MKIQKWEWKMNITQVPTVGTGLNVMQDLCFLVRSDHIGNIKEGDPISKRV